MDDGSLKVFGRDHPYLDRIESPEGEHCHCHYCEEPIEAWESGFSLMAVECDANPLRVYEHRECFLRQVVGSTAHVEKRCGCFIKGSKEGDGPGLTLRQAAREAVAAYYKRGGYGTGPEIKAHVQRQDN